MDDARQIENLIYLYAERIDAGDLEGVAALFRNATILSPGGQRCEGYDAIIAMYRRFTRIHENGTPRTQHVTTNVRIEIDDTGETGIAHSRFTVFQATDDLALQPIIAGRYEDHFVKKSGAWQFSSREMTPTLYGDVSQHLLATPT